MPPLIDLSRVRAILDRDRAWSAYAIGDLSPDLAPHCTWLAPADDTPALVLVYRGYTPPIVFAIGDAHALAPLFREIDEPIVALHVRPDALASMAPVYRAAQPLANWRMAVAPASFRPVPAGDVVPVLETDLEAVLALYEDGRSHHEEPHFFHPSMLRQGTFRGIREGGDLVAVAGTHLFSPEMGVCAVGNVYTRRDRRRQGFAARVTSAVVAHAIAQGISTSVLNVSQDKSGARRVYEQLGFQCHCEFLEGEAHRNGARRSVL